MTTTASTNASPNWTGWSDPTLETDLLAAISLDAQWSTLERFSTLTRDSDSPAEREAIDHLTGRLDSWGVPYTLHEPTCFISLPRGATLRVDGPNGKSFYAKTAAMGASTDGEVTGELVYVAPRVADGVSDDFSQGLDISGRDLAGKVVIADGMTTPGRVLDLMAAGALAGIFVNLGERIHESICTTIGGAPDLDSRGRQPAIPVLGVDKRDGAELIAFAQAGPTRVAFSTTVETGWRPIPVLVAEIPGATSPDEFVLPQGHLDSWFEGIGDNAVGDAAMLELARVFWERRDQLKRGLKIAWWSGHSHGRYAGSTWYADAFGVELAEGCVAQVNRDSPGRRWATTFNEPTVMSETAPFVDAAIRDTTGITPQTERPPRAGDYSFNGIGMSSFYMLSSTMSEADRAEKGYYGVGGCGANIAWHTEDDGLEIADRDNLLRDIRMYAASILRVTNAPLLPFHWRRTTAEFRATLNGYQAAAGDLFDFAPAVNAVAALDAALESFYTSAQSAPTDDGLVVFNRTQLRLARLLAPVNFSRVSPFHHDPALEALPLPDLAPAMTAPHVKNDQHERGMLQTSLLRGRNRLVWTLIEAREMVEASLR